MVGFARVPMNQALCLILKTSVGRVMETEQSKVGDKWKSFGHARLMSERESNTDEVHREHMRIHTNTSTNKHTQSHTHKNTKPKMLHTRSKSTDKQTVNPATG